MNSLKLLIRSACWITLAGCAVWLVGCGGKSETTNTTGQNLSASKGRAVDGGKFSEDDSENADDQRGDGAKSSDDESEDGGHAATEGGTRSDDDNESRDGGIARVDGGRSDDPGESN